MTPRRSLVLSLLLASAPLHAAPKKPVPAGVEGEAANSLAHAMERAVNLDAWQKTGAVKWTFAGHAQHLWDLRRMLDRVRIDDAEILVDLGTQKGKAWKKGVEVTGAEADELVKKGYASWANDSFWLNPIAKLFDAGVTRSLVKTEDGAQALLVHYASGGVTPGDSYLWMAGPDGKPKAVRMWVSVFPEGGMEVTWTGWTPLGTGAVVATTHAMGARSIPVSDVAGAATLSELEPGKDPFAPISTGSTGATTGK